MRGPQSACVFASDAEARVAVVCSRDGVGMDGWSMKNEQEITGNKGGK